MSTEPHTVTFIAEESVNLDTTCYRGSAPLADLARISAADVFDQVDNPEGLQRDLSKKHAAEAYAYAAREPNEHTLRAFPEVMLNVRDKAVVTVEPIDTKTPLRLVKLTFDLAKIERAKTVKVSRIDGNHRLYYAAGDGAERPPLTIAGPFSLTLGLTTEQEAGLFLDVNAEQKGLNTSHLAVLRSRLTPDDIEMQFHPERVFGRTLAEDAASPFHGLVHLGGSKAGTKAKGEVRPINFIALASGVKRTLAKSQYLPDLTTPDAKYNMIRTYWQAVQRTWPDAFANPKDFYVTKNIGVQALSILGATVIDRAMAAGHVTVDDLAELLEPTAGVYDWHRDAEAGGVTGMSGNRAALLVAGQLAEKVKKPRK